MQNSTAKITPFASYHPGKTDGEGQVRYFDYGQTWAFLTIKGGIEKVNHVRIYPPYCGQICLENKCKVK